MKISSVHDHSRRRALWILIALACVFAPGSSRGGTLAYFDDTVSPGMVRSIASPATSVAVDVEYDAGAAEGGGFYGFSEIAVVTTGDVVIDSGSFSCHAMNCLYFPNPFNGGTSIAMSAADDLNGEFTNFFQLLSISVTGTNGYVAIVGGEYIDATGASMNLGDVQTVTATVIAEVPEPGFGAALSMGCLALLAARRRRR